MKIILGKKRNKIFVKNMSNLLDIKYIYDRINNQEKEVIYLILIII